jgi:hypothetical protein
MISLLLTMGIIVLVGGALAGMALRPYHARRLFPAQPGGNGEVDRVQATALRQLRVARLEQHVQRERAAVERFPDHPTPADLRVCPPPREF